MAWNLGRVCCRMPHYPPLSVLMRLLPQFYSKFEVDVMDDFTSQLMRRKIGKWDLQKRKSEALVENSSRIDDKPVEEVQIAYLSPKKLDFLFQEAVDSDEIETVLNLVDSCVRDKILPSFSIVISVLSVCSQNGCKETVCRIKTLCENSYPDSLKEHSDFQHFVAEATWIRGDICKALDLFERVYRENAYLRRRVRLMLKYLISDSVSNRSEAALWKIISFSEGIFRDFQDFFPLTCVWQACFLSEWFTDQTVALQLLERNSGLCKSVVSRIPYVVFVSLKGHRTEVVYRLLEILLQYRMKLQCSNVLAPLLDYQFRCGNIHGCAEIVRWAVENNVYLPKNYSVKAINLLISHKYKMDQVDLDPVEKQDGNVNSDYKF